jgi:CheY-like chemotaxis protein
MDANFQNNVKILVVDDEIDLEPLIRQKFRRQIREGKYHFVFALNGLEALSRIIEYPESDRLSDINMRKDVDIAYKLKELQNPV